MAQPSIHFIGGGQMAEAIIVALTKGPRFAPAQISVTDVDPARRTRLHELYAVTTSEYFQGLGQATLVVLAVRPQDDLVAVAQAVRQAPRGALVVSIIAGVTVARLTELVGPGYPVVRVIPNTLTRTGFGYSGVAFAPGADLKADPVLSDFLTGFGKVELVDEALLDRFTGYGVAGPNYVYAFVEALVDAGVLAGLPRTLAWNLALENLKGAAAMLEQTKLHPRQLLDINNSPGGVGIHALYELNNSDFAAGLQRAVLAAVKRTEELGRP
jgi:pyrroline-5-carboxylate reductase